MDTELDLDDVAVGEGGERLVVGEGRDVRDGVVDRDGGREGDALGDLEALLVVNGGDELVNELVAGRAELDERLAGLDLGNELLEDLADDGRRSLVLGDAGRSRRRGRGDDGAQRQGNRSKEIQELRRSAPSSDRSGEQQPLARRLEEEGGSAEGTHTSFERPSSALTSDSFGDLDLS